MYSHLNDPEKIKFSVSLCLAKHSPKNLFSFLSYVHISTKTRARQAEARHTRTYALIATDSRSEYAWGKLKKHPLTVCMRMKLSLKYRLQVDGVRSASDRMEAVFLSLVTRLHCYVCLASACLAPIFVLMWTQLYAQNRTWLGYIRHLWPPYH